MNNSMFNYVYSNNNAPLYGPPHSNNMVTVSGEINDSIDDNTIQYVAASPIDIRSSFSGSGLPFANTMQAFENTPNKGEVALSTGNSFLLTLAHPSSYYIGLGSILVPPTVYISYKSKGVQNVITLKISEPIPYRTLSYPNSESNPRVDASFYKTRELPVRTQEQILKDSAYPCQYIKIDDFWGLKPPV
jgi:hypothetical protein